MPIFDSLDELQAQIEADVSAVFADAFPHDESGDGFSVPEELAGVAPMQTDDASVFPWRWRGLHRGPFFEVRPTGHRVDVVGVTIVTKGGEDGLNFHRIVDWLTLYRQLGLMMVCRRPQSPETFAFDDIDQPL